MAVYPIGSMYGIFTYMKTIKNQPNVGKYTNPVDPMGIDWFIEILRSWLIKNPHVTVPHPL